MTQTGKLIGISGGMQFQIMDSDSSSLDPLQSVRMYTIGNKLYVVGVGTGYYTGQYTISTDYNRDWSYIPSSNLTWTNHGKWLADASCVVIYQLVKMGNGNVILLGGVSLGGGSKVLRNTQYYTSNGYTWNTMSNASWAARWAFQALWYNNALWVLGGATGFYDYGTAISPRNAVNDVWKSTDYGTSWTQVTASAPWGTRYMHGACVYDNKMWIWGGGYYTTTSYARPDMWYSTDGVNWTQSTSYNSILLGYFYGGSSIVWRNKLMFKGSEVSVSDNKLYYTTNGSSFYTYRVLPATSKFIGVDTTTHEANILADDSAFVDVINDYHESGSYLLQCIALNLTSDAKLHRIS